MSLKRTSFALLLVFLFSPVSFLLPSLNQERLLWKENLLAEIASGPAIFNARAAVVTRNGGVFVFDADGRLHWSYKLGSPVSAAPSYDQRGRLWIADLKGRVWSFSAAGEALLVFKSENPIRATPLHFAEQVIICDDQGRITRLRAECGEVLESTSIEASVFSSGVVLAGGAILQPSKNYKVFRVESKNRLSEWFSAAGVLFSTPALFGDGRVALTSMDHHLYLLDAGGRELSRFKSGHWIIASPVLDETGRAYFGSYDRRFYAVDPNGKKAWSLRGPGGFNASPVLDQTGLVYTGDGSGLIYAINRKGETIWQYRTGDYMRTALALFPDRPVLLAGSLDGFLYALRAEAPMARNALWPSYLGDERNSGSFSPDKAECE